MQSQVPFTGEEAGASDGRIVGENRSNKGEVGILEVFGTWGQSEVSLQTTPLLK